MIHKDDAMEIAFDILVDEAAVIADKNINDRLPDEKEKIEFSKEHEAKMKKLFKNEKRKINSVKWVKYARRAACVLLVLGIGAGVGLYHADALRFKIFELVVQPGLPNSDIKVNINQGDDYQNGTIMITYMPDGYNLEFVSKRTENHFYEYQKENLSFSVSVSVSDREPIIDDSYEIVREFTINGNKAFLCTIKAAFVIKWFDGENRYSVQGNIGEDELIRIAENIYVK